MNKYLKPTLLSLVVALSLNQGSSHAVTFVNQDITFLAPPYPAGEDVFTFCADQGICAPGQTVVFTTGQGTATSINNNDNDTSLTFTSAIYEILSPDAEWGMVTTNGELTIDGKIATFTGLIPPGEGLRVERTLSGDSNPVTFAVTFTSTPEPSSLVGIMGLAALGVVRKLLRQ